MTLCTKLSALILDSLLPQVFSELAKLGKCTGLRLRLTNTVSKFCESSLAYGPLDSFATFSGPVVSAEEEAWQHQRFPFRTYHAPDEPHPGLRSYPFLGQVCRRWQGLLDCPGSRQDLYREVVIGMQPYIPLKSLSAYLPLLLVVTSS